MSRTLLPSGCYDLLPPFARQETLLLSALLSHFEMNGYAQVSPPLLEYTESLLAGRGADTAAQVFRVMDPETNKVMGLRPDITLQIARIAATRLAHAPLPLRLSYAGNVLRTHGEGLSTGRQLRQAGIELIGAESAEADAEVIIVAAEALTRAGLKRFSVDLHLPSLVGALLADEALNEAETAEVLAAVAHKDASAPCLARLSGAGALKELMFACGSASEVLPRLRDARAEPVRQVAALLAHALPDGVEVTVDLTEAWGFAYYHGVSYSLFAPGAAQDIGRGGRYRIDGVEATGCTLYLDGLRRLLPAPPEPERVLVAGGDAAILQELQAQGYVTLRALSKDAEAEAKRLGCGFYWAGGRLIGL